MSLRRFAIAALGLVCSGQPALAAPTAPAAAKTVAPAAAKTASPAQPLPAAPIPGEVELLHNVPSVVVVSSLVNNKKMRAEQLVDGKLSTAWNSKTDELGKSTIDFFVPPETYVSTIRIAAGYLAKGDTGDLYTQNHRITKVRLSGDGYVLGDFNLDPQRRELQELPVNQARGHFTIEVLDTLRGSKAEWREVCISELEVWGTPPPRLPPRRQEPIVRVGKILWGGEPNAKLEADCKKKSAQIAAEMKANRDNTPYPPSDEDIAGSHCSIDKPSEGAAVKSPFKWGFLYDTQTAGSSWMSSTSLVIHTPKGWNEYSLWSDATMDDPHCGGTASTTLNEVTGSARELSLRYTAEETRNPIDGFVGSRSKKVTSRTCVLGPDRMPICIERVLLSEEGPY